jgi:outer membrane protein
MHGLRFLFHFLFVPFIIVSVSAQSQSDHTYISMEEAIARALKQNNQVRASEYAVKQANWNKKNAWTHLFPRITFNSRYTWIDDSTLALRDFSQYFDDPNLPFKIPKTVFQNAYYSSIDLTMPILNFNLFNGISLASSSEDMAEHLNESTKRTIVFQVVRGYLNVLKRKEIFEMQRKYSELSRLNYEKAERLFKAGRYSKTDALRWKVEQQQQLSIVTSSESDLRSARIMMSRLLNARRGESFDVENRIPSSLLIESKRLLTLEDHELLGFIDLDDEELMTANAALAAAKESEEMSETVYRNSYNAYLPVINLSYSYAWRENDTWDFDDYSPKTLMLNLGIPLFTSFQNYTQLKSSYYAYKKDHEDFYNQLQNIRFILTETVNKLLNLKTQKELSVISVEFNEQNYRVVEQQKEKGLVSNIEFIDAKLNIQNARISDISNYYDFVTGMVELYYLLGKLEEIIE